MASSARLTNNLTVQHPVAGRQPAAASPPPPYSPAESDSDMDDDDSDDSDDDEPIVPVKLTINAAHQIRGSNNLIPTSPNALADATRFSTLLLHAVDQINAANGLSRSSQQQQPQRRRKVMLKVDLTINCGITVVGDRNVIGNVGLKPKTAGAGGVMVGNLANAVIDLPNTANAAAAGPTPPTTPAAVAGAKRKAEGEPVCEAEGGSAAKRSK